ncbi:MAG: Fe-S-containing protein [Bacteroidota bacterium]
MIESAIIALREGIEISLVIAILIVYIQKIQKPYLLKAVYLGLAAAFLGSIGGAALLIKLGIDSESLEGFFMLFAAIFVISMIVWMWMTANKIKTEIEGKIDSIVAASSRWKAYAGVFTFTFFMIVREGLETAVFLQAVALSAGAWKSILGTTAGLSLAAVFCVFFIRGSVRIDIGKFLKVTACTLIIFTLQLIINALHEFYENGVFPASPKMMAILGPMVQNDTFFIIAILSIPAFMLLIGGRKQKTSTKSQRRWQLSAGIATICITLFLGVGEIFSSNPVMNLNADMITPHENGTIEIPLSQIQDGNIHRYSIKDGELTIRFFAIRTGVGKFSTAFDACKACYSYGKYYLKNNELICSQCDAPSPLSSLRPSVDEAQIDTTGTRSAMEGNGCHPIYLPSYISNGSIVVKVADLQKERKYFDITE